MRKGILLAIAIAGCVAAPLSVNAEPRACEDLKAEIQGKLEAKGVKNYTLEIVAAAQAEQSGGKVVGSCEGGAKKIVYKKGG